MKLNLKESFDFGNQVVCDICDADFTGSDEVGGILFGGKACCPQCAPRIEALAIKYNEQEHIKARCPEGMAFYEWALSLRGGNNEVKIYTIA